MVRPVSIVWFERCYLGALALGLLNTLVQWPELMAKAAARPGVDQFGPGFIPTVTIVTLIVSYGISLLLWYFAARRRATVAKWIIAIFFVLGLLAVGFSALTGNFAHGLAGVIAVVGLVLQAIAVWNLFRPDAEAWFTGTGPVGGVSPL